MTRFLSRNRTGVLLVVAACFLGACSSEGVTGPTPTPTPIGGWLTVQLSTPNANDGAVQFSVSGPSIDSVKLVSYDGFDSNTGTQVDLVATGDIKNGDVARVYVPDLSRTAEYHVDVSAAAARDTWALQDLAGYRAVLVR
jgi:hypothetical protein